MRRFGCLKVVIIFWFLLFLIQGTSSAAKASTSDLICSGGDEVFIIDSAAAGADGVIKKWSWRASDSPEILPEIRSDFRTTDECKPFGEFILITSSAGGVALVRRSDKRTVFYTRATNAHSACLLPGERIAVASSFGGDQLLVFSISDGSGTNIDPLTQIPLHGAHGAHWDTTRNRLWALGSEELKLIQVTRQGRNTVLQVERRWDLPTPGGHDLSPARDHRSLYVTTNTNVYRFVIEDGVFLKDDKLGDLPKVKSIDEHPLTGLRIYQKAGQNWWSEAIRFGVSDRVIELPGERLYKVRWDAPREIP